MSVSKIIQYKWFLPCLVVAFGAYVLKDYFFPPFQILIAILIAPFILYQRTNEISNRYFFVSAVLAFIYIFSGSTLFLFFATGTFFIYSIESRIGKLSSLAFVFLLCISPVVHYLVDTFTFDLRLLLSGYASKLLNAAGFNVQSNGNSFSLPDGTIFTVDSGCLGLNMYNTGLALTCLLIAQHEKTSEKNLHAVALMAIFLTSSLLLIIANFFRIVGIVFFRSMPGTLSHDLIGTICLVLYMVLPVYFFVKYSFNRAKYNKLSAPTQQEYETPSFSTLRPIILFGLLFFAFKYVSNYASTYTYDEALDNIKLSGFVKTKTEGGVIEFRNTDLLVYVKPAVGVLQGDHSPSKCWKGSGFEVGQITSASVNNVRILKAVLKKNNLKQYTAWWYDNGSVKTTNQLTWRFSKGKPFRLVNLTCSDEDKLDAHIKHFLTCDLFS